jgi:hypothetical protein
MAPWNMVAGKGEILVSDSGFDDATQRVHAAIDGLFNAMKDVEGRDPHFMATMRRYGLIQRVQELMEANASLSDQIARILKEREM